VTGWPLLPEPPAAVEDRSRADTRKQRESHSTKDEALPLLMRGTDRQPGAQQPSVPQMTHDSGGPNAYVGSPTVCPRS
jgi:hypothetical protein